MFLKFYHNLTCYFMKFKSFASFLCYFLFSMENNKIKFWKKVSAMKNYSCPASYFVRWYILFIIISHFWRDNASNRHLRTRFWNVISEQAFKMSAKSRFWTCSVIAVFITMELWCVPGFGSRGSENDEVKTTTSRLGSCGHCQCILAWYLCLRKLSRSPF